MKWQRVARAIVALVGIGTAVAIFVLSRPRQTTLRPAPTASTDPAASVQSGRGEVLRFSKSNELVASVKYKSQKDYPDGRSVYEDLALSLQDGTTISAKRVEARGKSPTDNLPAEWAMRGDVRMAAQDSTSLAGAEGSYNHVTGIATIPGAVSFTRGRISGTGKGGTYDRNGGVFTILSDAKVRIAGDSGGQGRVEATSQTMTFVRGSKSMVFEGSPRLGRPSEVLTADRTTVYLSDDEDRFRAVELRGNAVVAPAAGQGASLPDMRATDIDLTFYPGGQALERANLTGAARLLLSNAQGRRSIEAPHINVSTASDGKTLTRLEGGQPVTVSIPAGERTPERTIAAQSLVATGTEKDGLTLAVFDGGAQFTETVPSAAGRASRRRSGTSRTLKLAMRGSFDTIDEAQFWENVKFQDGALSADADLGIYRSSRESTLELQPLARMPRRILRVDNGDITVNAAEIITVNLDTNDVHARTGVTTVRAAEKEMAAPSASGLFSRSERWLGSAYEFDYEARSKTLRYQQGPDDQPAQIRQPDGSAIAARDITISEGSLDLAAKGNVDTTFLAASGDRQSPADAMRHRVTADALDYVQAARTAAYTGAPAVMRRENSETRALKIVLTLAEADRRLDRLQATGQVRSALGTDRQALAEELTYDAAKDQYVLKNDILKGTKVKLQTKETDSGKCTIATGNLARFTGTVGAPDFPGAENPGGSLTLPGETCGDLMKP